MDHALLHQLESMASKRRGNDHGLVNDRTSYTISHGNDTPASSISSSSLL